MQRIEIKYVLRYTLLHCTFVQCTLSNKRKTAASKKEDILAKPSTMASVGWYSGTFSVYLPLIP